jgi:hypothetical protein
MEARSVTWLHRGGAEMASYRLRAQIPSAYCNDDSRINATGADISVFAKPHPDDLEVLRQINARGAKTVVDLCDDHFNHPQLGELYEAMVREAHAVVCPTQEMARRIRSHTQREAQVIPDSWENRGQPHADGNKFLWLGHQSNLKEILPYHAMLKKYDMTYCTGANDQVECVPWSTAAQEQLLENNTWKDITGNHHPTRRPREAGRATRDVHAKRQAWEACLMPDALCHVLVKRNRIAETTTAWVRCCRQKADVRWMACVDIWVPHTTHHRKIIPYLRHVLEIRRELVAPTRGCSIREEVLRQ